jgi:fructosamine-3-kinase
VSQRTPRGLYERVGQILGLEPTAAESLSGGCVAQLYLLRMPDGGDVVAKVDDSPSPQLELEAFMLRYLAEHSPLPVPEVLHAENSLLLMTYIPGRNQFSQRAQRHAAELMAALHDVTAPSFGFERDTLIGGLHQPNPQSGEWLAFFRDHRLLYMGREALGAGRLPGALFARLERFCAHLDRFLVEPGRPALIHGDAWGGNILASADRIVGFLDPAIYYADPEIELAFTTLFGTFGEPFFQRYREIRPLDPGFEEARRDVYNLYPLLVHVRLFGGGYVSSVDGILGRLGY